MVNIGILLPVLVNYSFKLIPWSKHIFITVESYIKVGNIKVYLDFFITTCIKHNTYRDLILCENSSPLHDSMLICDYDMQEDIVSVKLCSNFIIIIIIIMEISLKCSMPFITH
jgi:hypothetical protein